MYSLLHPITNNDNTYYIPVTTFENTNVMGWPKWLHGIKV